MTVLYHYCSNNAFQSIIENSSIRLSSLSLSNDSMEGKLVIKIIEKLARDDGLDEISIQRLRQHVALLEKIIDGLGFCLSKKGDLLSQWRGYADDACGVSIGFSKEYLEQLAEASLGTEKAGFSLQKVEYEPSEQILLVKPIYTEIKELVKKGAFKLPRKPTILTGLPSSQANEEIANEEKRNTYAFLKLSQTVPLLISKLFLLKTKGFREEKEWRLISYFVKLGRDTCRFLAVGDRIVPYREYEITESKESSIVKVIIGPKNLTPEDVIGSFLKQHGFASAQVVRSEATYR